MPLSQDEAASALKEIERTGSYTRELQSYAGAAPHFIVWGLVWMFGYAMTEVLPEYRNVFWGSGIAAGTLASIVLGRMTGREREASPFTPWRYAAISGSIAAFFGMTSVILKFDARQIDAFIPLMFAGMYLLAGLFAGVRFAICGAVLGMAVVVGYFNAGEHFGLWMAACGGGILLLTGFWLRRV